MLRRLKRIFASNGDEQPPKDAPLGSNGGIAIQVDRPIESASEDLFDRALFARQIATIVSARRDPSSLTVGLYAPWGDGKTSTLSMIKQFLQPDAGVITMDYNPWFYGDSTEAITRSFFGSIQSKLERSGYFSRDNIGGLMANYGKSIPYVGDAVERLGEVMTSEALAETRDKLGAILRKHGKKIVIFIDDIDRLDRSEIQTLFKLVRLSGGFDHTTYVLAFDDRIVSDALGETYGPREPLAGQRFLEKIVQVPLHLPAAKPEKLRQLMFAACDRVLGENEIGIDERHGSELGNALATAFVHALNTPRQVKLFENAISFAVPLLKGEARVIDQIQIEALRVFYPSVYDVVRKNPDSVLRSRNTQDSNERPSPIELAIRQIVGNEEERETIRNLLVELFPRFGTSSYGSDWDRWWAEEKRICSVDYFQRYFTYAVPLGDISDLLMDDLLTRAVDGNDEAVSSMIRGAHARDASEVLIRKLRTREKVLPLAAVPTIVTHISSNASAIPLSRDLFSGNFVLVQAATLVVNLAARLPPADEDANLLTSIQRSDSLLFAAYVISGSQATKRTARGRPPLPPARIHPLTAALVDRIQDTETVNLLDRAGDKLSTILFVVLMSGSEQSIAALKTYLRNALTENFTYGIRFIKAFAGQSQGSDGVIRIGDITREVYDTMGQLLDRDLIYKSLLAQFGDSITQAEWRDEDDEVDLDRRIADQFAYLYLHPSEPRQATEPE